MKKLIATLSAMILVLLATGCDSVDTKPTKPITQPHSTVAETTQTTTEFKTLEHLELKSNEIPYNNRWVYDDLEKVGLERTNTQIRESGFITEQSKYQKDIRNVILLRDFERYGHGICRDLFLAVEADTKVIFKDLKYNTLTGAYSEKLYINDIDSDGIDEIIIHQCVGMTGGAGQYLARVFKIENDEIKEIFCSFGNNESGNHFDTGFSGYPEDNNTFIITNDITGYRAEYKDSPDRLDRYDEDGKALPHLDIMVDHFNVFLPKDIDSDGTCEIYCEQYTSDQGHADYIGEAISILKYNNEKQDFEVIDAWFEPVDTLK
ncbi:MAG: hypothetical protein IJ451_04540 [Ruminococcus sp.]|nr:hypothetical protein [Ruminococcus sp.]